MLLFKYLNADSVLRSLEYPDNVVLKFGLPSSFNDPYELFLQPDQALDSEEHLAFYDYFLSEIPQLPVACFSKHPNSVAMWAHYARDQSGACLAFDEDTLANMYPVAYVDDVIYSRHPAQIDSDLINYAFATGKRRHTLALLSAANRLAYFTKRTEWQYEGERRLVVSLDDVQEEGSHLISRVPGRVLRAIIIGRNSDKTVRQRCNEWGLKMGVPVMDFRISQRTYEPFFLQDAQPLSWRGTEFVALENVCSECGDPCVVGQPRCRWCGISDKARAEAPKRSMLTATLHYGIDDGIEVDFRGLQPKGHQAPTKPDNLGGHAEF